MVPEQGLVCEETVGEEHFSLCMQREKRVDSASVHHRIVLILTALVIKLGAKKIKNKLWVHWGPKNKQA